MMTSGWETRQLVMKLRSEHECWDALEKLKKLGWYPTDPKEKAYYYFAKSQLRDFLRKEKKAANVLTAIVSDPSESKELRMEAARTVGEARIRSSTDALIKALDAEEEGVRNYAAIALGLIGDHKAVEPLECLLPPRHPKDAGRISRELAATAIARIGGDRAKSILKRSLGTESRFAVKSRIKLGLVGIDVAGHLENIEAISSEAIDRFRERSISWDDFRNPKDLVERLFDTFEYYTRAPVLELKADRIIIVIDNCVELKGETAPATKRMEIMTVKDESKYYRFDF